MLKNKILLAAIIFSITFGVSFAGELDSLKADFLRGNYRRVIFEGQSQADKVRPSNLDELNYLVGLSLLKENRTEEAVVYFNKILASQSDKFKERAKSVLLAKNSHNPASGEYSVQVGFFTSANNADNFKDKLLAKGYPAYLEGTGAGYRVKAGKFKAYQEALDLERKLSKEGFQTKICP